MVEIDRIDGLLARHGDHFLTRCFTPAERTYCAARHTPAMHFAARFCVKEALVKALGTGFRGTMAWTDISVESDPLGKPRVRLSGATADIAAARGITYWHISISHTRQHAIASVIAESAAVATGTVLRKTDTQPQY